MPLKSTICFFYILLFFALFTVWNCVFSRDFGTLAAHVVTIWHCCKIPPGLLGQFGQKNSAAGDKFRPQAGHPT